MDTEQNFTTPSAPLNQALQAAYEMGAGKTLANPQAELLDPMKAVTLAAGYEWVDPPSGWADLRQWNCSYPALDRILLAADMMGGQQANMDVGLMMLEALDVLAADLDWPPTIGQNRAQG